MTNAGTSKRRLDSGVNDTVQDYAMGALLGALVGDAAGGILEFLGRAPTEDEVEKALRFPGGGCHRLAPGQITDDGELMLCLAGGLASGAPVAEARLESVAYEYCRWVHSSPFDIGNTTMSALGAPEQRDLDLETCADAMTTAAAKRCMKSKANGILMRCMPWAVWGRELGTSELANWARLDSSLSHPHAACTDGVAAYLIAMAWLLRNPGDGGGAYEAALTWAKPNACDEVVEWLGLSVEELVPTYPLAGFVKIAFCHAFHHLVRGSSYEDAMRTTLRGGGDTDTNACIVGGLLGALHGASSIPKPWQDAVLGCNTDLGRPRPECLSASNLPRLLESLLKQ